MKTYVKLFICVVLAGMTTSIALAATNSTINASKKWAWSSSIGWINCKSDSTNGMVVGQYVCSGYMYSPTEGWISLGNGNPSNGIQYATNSATDYGVNHDGQGHLSGYAWSPSAGWINFGWTNATDPQAPKIDLKTGVLYGYAWGTGVGWISLSNLSTYVKTDSMYPGTSSISNGIPDAWIIQNFVPTNGFSGLADSDTDGVINAYEYIAGTDPWNLNDVLKVTDLSLSNGNLQIAWSSKESRLYKIDMKTSLFDSAWVDCGIGTNYPAEGSRTVTNFPLVATQGFYRVKAILPLQ
jgi:hypothetical protein